MKNNTLIAEFMGLTHHKGDNCEWWTKGDAFYPILSYDGFWGELMPVIEKIDSLTIDNCICCQTYHTSHTFYIHYNHNNTRVSDRYPSYSEGRLRAEGEYRIDNVFLAIVDFIKWYNALTPTPQP